MTAYYINLTPHDIVIEPCPERPSGWPKTIVYPDMDVLRVATQRGYAGVTTDGTRIMTVKPTPEGIADALDLVKAKLDSNPLNEKGYTYILVSGVALDMLGPHLPLEWRYRVLAPDTSPESAVRDDDGKIVSVRSLRGVI